MKRTYESAGPVLADVTLPAGRIRVTDCGTGQVTAELEPLGPAAGKAEDVIASSEVSFDGRRLRIDVPGKGLRKVEIACTVALPGGSSLEANTASADVVSEIPLAGCTVTTASGDVELGDVTGNLTVSAASGDVRADRVDGSVDLKAASSDFRVSHLEGEARIRLASGDVVIEESLASVTARSASGDLLIGAALGGEITVDTASGDVVIGVAPGVGTELDVATVSGDARCTLGFEEQVGDATLRVRCRSMSGDVLIRGAS